MKWSGKWVGISQYTGKSIKYLETFIETQLEVRKCFVSCIKGFL